MAILRALSGLMIASVALWSLGRVSSWCWTVFESLVSLQPGLPGFRVLWRRISDKSDQDGLLRMESKVVGQWPAWHTVTCWAPGASEEVAILVLCSFGFTLQ